MVLDFSNSKSFLLRVIIYFAVLALSFRFVGYFVAEQLPVLFEGLLQNGASGNLDFGGDLALWELISEWTTNGLSDFLSGFLSVGLAGIADPSIRIGFSRLSMGFVSRPVLATI